MLNCCRLAAQGRFGLETTPRLVRDTAERHARLADLVALELERGRDRDQGEGIGQPVTDLQIAVVL